MPGLSNNRRIASVAAAGAVLVLIAVGIAMIPAGDTLRDQLRTVAHGVGFAGMVPLISAGLMNPGSRKQQLVALVIGVPVVLVCIVEAMRRDYILAGFGGFLLNALILGIASWLTLKLIESSFGWNVQRVPIILVAGGLCTVVSLGWECYVQPFVTVYGLPKRGFIQEWHVGADLTGIICGMLLSGALLDRLRLKRLARITLA